VGDLLALNLHLTTGMFLVKQCNRWNRWDAEKVNNSVIFEIYSILD